MSVQEAKASVKPVLFFDLQVDGNPVPVIDNKVKSVSYAPINGGSLKSIDSEFPFEATIYGGTDTITLLKTGKKSQSLDCKVYLKSKGGKGVYITYGGVAIFNEKVAELIGKTSEHLLSYEDAYITSNVTVEFDDDLEEEYKWIQDYNITGKGRFIRDSNGTIRVQYYLYVLV